MLNANGYLHPLNSSSSTSPLQAQKNSSKRSVNRISQHIPYASWEKFCDEILLPKRKLKLDLDFELESKLAERTAGSSPACTYASPTTVGKKEELSFRRNKTLRKLRGKREGVTARIIKRETSSSLKGKEKAKVVEEERTGEKGAPKGRENKTEKTILRNVPTVKGGLWNSLMGRMPSIMFVKKFETEGAAQV